MQGALRPVEVKKLIMIQCAYYPSKKAHANQIYSMSQAFVANGYDVELWLPSPLGKKRMAEEEWGKYYGEPKAFNVKYFTVFPIINYPSSLLIKAIAYCINRINGWVFAISTIIATIMKIKSPKNKLLAFTRDNYFLFLANLFLKSYRKKPYLIAEIHDIPAGLNRFILKYGLHSVDLIIAISKGLKESLIETFPNMRSTIVTLPDGINSGRLKSRMSRGEALAYLSMEKLEHKKLIVYTGHLYPYYGVDLLINAMKYLDKNRFILWLVGGEHKDLERAKKLANHLGISNIVFWGWQEPGKIKYFQWAADILVAPYSAKKDRLYKFCSPLKIFEYMSAERPILASKTPALQEILINSENSILFEADNARDLASSIEMLVNNPTLSRKLAAKAFNDVHNYTWEQRAKKIIDIYTTKQDING